MAIIECQECGKKHSDNMASCPFCRPGGISKRDRTSKAIFITLIAVSVVFFGIYHTNNYFSAKRANARAQIARIEAAKIIAENYERAKKEHAEKKNAEMVAKKPPVAPVEPRTEKSFSIERFYKSSDSFYRVLVKTTRKQPLRCIATAEDGAPIKVTTQIVTPPADEVIMSTGDATYRVSGVECYGGD